MRRKYVLATLSNGNVALLVNMAKRAGLPWDAILGAEPGRVVRLVVTQGSRLVLTGLVLGMIGALIGNRFIAALLYEIEPSDPISLGLAGAILAFVAMLATTVPAWRASRVAPAEALRPD